MTTMVELENYGLRERVKDLRIGEMKQGERVEYYVFVCAINNTNKLDFKKKRPS